MKRSLVMLVILILSTAASAQQIGGLGVGWTTYTGENDNLSAISNHGISLLALVPVHTSAIDVSVKLKLAHFSNIRSTGDSYQYKLANVSNELLAGKKLVLKNIIILPQLGYGIRAESRYIDWDVGYFRIDTFLDYSILLSRTVGAVDLGLLINYETDLKSIDESMKSGRRFNLSVVLSK